VILCISLFESAASSMRDQKLLSKTEAFH
jgi:hypothetical protein